MSGKPGELLGPDAFRRVAAGIQFESPRLPFVSNVTGEIVAAGARLDADYWVQHVRATVRFADGLQALHQSGIRTFLKEKAWHLKP